MTNLRAGGEKAAGAAFLRGMIGFAVKRPIEMEGEGRTGAARGEPSRAEQSAEPSIAAAALNRAPERSSNIHAA
jgi:hypothetical protein